MRKFATRSLITLAAMTTTMLAVPTAVRSQPKPTTPNTTTSVEISRPANPTLPSGKKASFVKMFEDIAIAPKFTPKEIELRGISGGGVETQTKSGRKVTETGDCIGFVDAEPDHKITLTEPFRSLKMQVKSSGDTILLVRGPGGSWCNIFVRSRVVRIHSHKMTAVKL